MSKERVGVQCLAEALVVVTLCALLDAPHGREGGQGDVLPSLETRLVVAHITAWYDQHWVAPGVLAHTARVLGLEPDAERALAVEAEATDFLSELVALGNGVQEGEGNVC